ncbi:MAG TPA: FtsX-like permease family protein [Chloroflexota bacterium]|nr:FtsX-like permease family protein [Chloroflexota bacterium]
MDALTLYIRYAFRSFLRGRSRSVFGAFCVAVGIASVVALGLAAGNFKNAVTADARQTNRGDVSVSPAGLGFTFRQYAIFGWLQRRGEIADYTSIVSDDSALRSPAASGASTIGSVYAVDPAKFPFYDTITAVQPAGKTLRALISNPGNAVVSQDTLDALHLRVGDRIVVNSRRGFNHAFTIAGVVPDSAPNPGFGAGFWNDFAMVNRAAVLPFFRSLDVAGNEIFLKTSSAAQAQTVKLELERHLGGFPQIKTVADVARDDQNSASGFDKFFRVMSLVAVVIGGIGIINTMMVAARRRSREVAVLKALGMKGRQVVFVFTIEALILAIAGAALGLLGGIGASVLVNSVTQNLAGYAIPWSLQSEPLIAGATVGVVATVLFSYLPVLRASRARPIAALRGELDRTSGTGRLRHIVRSLRTHPVGSILSGARRAPAGIRHLPRRQGLRSFLLVLVRASLTGSLAIVYAGLASGTSAVVTGTLAGIGVLAGAAVLTELFVGIIWLVSKLPSIRRLTLRMAFRSMGTQKRRLGSTLLAMCIGILAVGSVAIMAQNIRSVASNAITNQLGIKAIVQSPNDSAITRRLSAEVATLPGITEQDFGEIANGAMLTAIDGRSVNRLLQSQISAGKLSRDSVDNVAYDLRGVEGRDSARIRYPLTITSGHNLQPQDVGKDSIVIDSRLEALGARVGSRLVFDDGGRNVSFMVVGIYTQGASFGGMASSEADVTYMRRIGMARHDSAHLSLLYLNMRDGVVAADIATLRRAVKGVLVLDMGAFVSVFDKALDKLTLFPEIIAALSLFAGVIIIANTVALAMLERRREIGVMKAVGARRRTILQFLLAENAIVGLLGAGAGVGLAMLVTVLIDQSFLKIAPSFDPATIFGLLGLGVALAVGASAATALPASSEKPMTVLRYE